MHEETENQKRKTAKGAQGIKDDAGGSLKLTEALKDIAQTQSPIKAKSSLYP